MCEDLLKSVEIHKNPNRPLRTNALFSHLVPSLTLYRARASLSEQRPAGMGPAHLRPGAAGDSARARTVADTTILDELVRVVHLLLS